MTHGGARKKSGRKSQFGCETKPIRVPSDLIPSIYQFIQNKGFKLPLYSSKVSAGAPGPAEDHIQDNLDLNAYLVKHPSETFLVQATGNSMIGAGIFENDILIVDRSIAAIPGKVVVAAIDGQLTVKRLQKDATGKIYLMPENPDYTPIELNEESNIHIWGVVLNVIHAV